MRIVCSECNSGVGPEGLAQHRRDHVFARRCIDAIRGVLGMGSLNADEPSGGLRTFQLRAFPVRGQDGVWRTQ